MTRSEERPISVAIVAMGGQGGGVLADWIATAARASGFIVQATSVPGVAQRTGATIYYLELVRRRTSGGLPVLAMMPTPGDVDVVIAAELMEAGRAIVRGLVTPDRTLLIASRQRAFAVVEKETPGDGIADSGAVVEAAGIAAKRVILRDFQAIAQTHQSVISAALLGAVAASGALGFDRATFEAAIRDGGVGAAASWKAFDAAYMASLQPDTSTDVPLEVTISPGLQATGNAALDRLINRIKDGIPAEAQDMTVRGVAHLVDYQDIAYAHEYLSEIERIAEIDRAADGDNKGYVLTVETARHLARAMAYDDIIRVADLKVRSARARRVVRETGVNGDRQLLQTTEFFHPRMEEICATLPARLGAAIESRPRLFGALDRVVNRGRRVRTDTISGFLSLYLIAGRRHQRRKTLRHGREMAHVQGWLGLVRSMAAINYDLATEVAKARRLVKGYADTMARGLSKYDRVMAGAKTLSQRADAADWVRRLHQSAMLDESGAALEGALRTVATISCAPATTTSPTLPAQQSSTPS